MIIDSPALAKINYCFLDPFSRSLYVGNMFYFPLDIGAPSVAFFQFEIFASFDVSFISTIILL